MFYHWKLRTSAENIYVRHQVAFVYFLEHNVKRFHSLYIDDKLVFLWLIKDTLFIFIWYPGYIQVDPKIWKKSSKPISCLVLSSNGTNWKIED